MNPVEIAALKCCATLLETPTAKRLPRDLAEAFAIAAFSVGAAWALDRPDLIELANAEVQSGRARTSGSIS